MGHPNNRGERRSQRERILRNRLKLVVALEQPERWGVYRYITPNAINRRAGARGFWYEHPGRFHKKKPYDCGRAGCPHCHFSKVYHSKEKRITFKNDTRSKLEELE